jgi:exopolysaccharide biosynthesis polyprenyl glycosylphosphotransferase
MTSTATPQTRVVDAAVASQGEPVTVARSQTEPATHLVLHENGARNMRRHVLRAARRVTVLVGADLAVFAVLSALAAGLRSVGATPLWFAEAVRTVFPPGFLGGWRFGFALIVSLLVAGAYGAGDRRRDVGRLLAGSALAAALSLYHLVWELNVFLVAAQFVATVAVVASALATERWIVDEIVKLVRPRVGAERVVVVRGDRHSWIDPPLGRRAKGFDPSSGWRLVGTVVAANGDTPSSEHSVGQLGNVIEQCNADTVAVCGPISDQDFARVVDTALASGCRLVGASRTARVGGVEGKSVWEHGTPLVQFHVPTLKAWQLAAKRLLDIVGAAAGLALLGPALLAIAVAVRLYSRGPVLFGQVRLGARGRRFRCLKYRSMRTDAEKVLQSDPHLYRLYRSSGYKLPEDRDPRLTRVGRFLRRTSLDELPQLINVLMGDMSLVGPRPIVPSEIEHYCHDAPLFLSLKPGMTGAWAVNGRSNVGYPDRAQMELEYVRNWSLHADVGILLCTIPAVLRGRGAH